MRRMHRAKSVFHWHGRSANFGFTTGISKIWVAPGACVLRCAPEQLRFGKPTGTWGHDVIILELGEHMRISAWDLGPAAYNNIFTTSAHLLTLGFFQNPRSSFQSRSPRRLTRQLTRKRRRPRQTQYSRLEWRHRFHLTMIAASSQSVYSLISDGEVEDLHGQMVLVSTKWAKTPVENYSCPNADIPLGRDTLQVEILGFSRRSGDDLAAWTWQH